MSNKYSFPPFFPCSKLDGQTSRHGIRVSSYMYITNLSDKQASKQASKKKNKKINNNNNHHFFRSKGGGEGGGVWIIPVFHSKGVLEHPKHPPPPLSTPMWTCTNKHKETYICQLLGEIGQPTVTEVQFLQESELSQEFGLGEGQGCHVHV